MGKLTQVEIIQEIEKNRDKFISSAQGISAEGLMDEIIAIKKILEQIKQKRLQIAAGSRSALSLRTACSKSAANAKKVVGALDK